MCYAAEKKGHHHGKFGKGSQLDLCRTMAAADAKKCKELVGEDGVSQCTWSEEKKMCYSAEKKGHHHGKFHKRPQHGVCKMEAGTDAKKCAALLGEDGVAQCIWSEEKKMCYP